MPSVIGDCADNFDYFDNFIMIEFDGELSAFSLSNQYDFWPGD